MRFTDYVKKTSGSEGFRFGGTAVLASYMQAKTAYTCPICCSNRTFYSPEELGTHVALCYGPASQDQNSNKKAEASGGTNKRGKSGSGQLLTVETAATGTLKTLEGFFKTFSFFLLVHSFHIPRTTPIPSPYHTHSFPALHHTSSLSSRSIPNMWRSCACFKFKLCERRR